MSYHGGVRSSEFEDASPAQMKAYKERRNGRYRRGARDAEDSDNQDVGEDEDGEDASWTDMTVASTPEGSQKQESAPRRKGTRRQCDLESIEASSQYGNYSTYSLGEESEYTGRS